MPKKDVYVRIMLDGWTINPHVFVMNNIIKNPPQKVIDQCGKPFGKKKRIVCILATEAEAEDARETGMLLEGNPKAIKPDASSIDMDGDRLKDAPKIKTDDDNGGWNKSDDEDEPEEKPVVKKKITKKKAAKKKAKKKVAKKKVVKKKAKKKRGRGK